MTTEERDKIREETELPGWKYDGSKKLPASDCGDPLQDIINDIKTLMEHDAKYWGYA